MKSLLPVWYFLVLSALTLALLTGCAGLPHKTEDPATVLRTRSAACLQAKMDQDWASAYGFFDSTFKEEISPEYFEVLPKATETMGFSILDVTVSETGKTAEVRITEDIKIPQGFTFPGVEKTQTWILERGKWMLVEPLSSPADFQ